MIGLIKWLIKMFKQLLETLQIWKKLAPDSARGDPKLEVSGASYRCCKHGTFFVRGGIYV